MPHIRDELNRSVREEIIESRQFINSMEGVGSRSQDSGAELIMHSFTVDCDSFSNKAKFPVVVRVTSVETEVAGSEAMLALSFSTLLLKCLMKILGMSEL